MKKNLIVKIFFGTGICFILSWVAAVFSANNDFSVPYPTSIFRAYGFGLREESEKSHRSAHPVHVERKFSGVEEIDLRGVSADMEIGPSPGPEVEVEVTGNFSSEEEALSAEQNGGRLVLQTEKETGNGKINFFSGITINFDGDSMGSPGAHLRLLIPANLQSLGVKNVSGDVKLANRQIPRLEIRLVSGDLTALGLESREMDVKTVSGNIKWQLKGPLSRFEIKTVSGNIELEANGLPDASLHFQSVSGEISTPGFGEVNCGRGSCTLGRGQGEIRAKTVSGDFRLKKI